MRVCITCPALAVHVRTYLCACVRVGVFVRARVVASCVADPCERIGAKLDPVTYNLLLDFALFLRSGPAVYSLSPCVCLFACV